MRSLAFDTHYRIVSLESLKAMCKRVSGHCHRFEVESASRSRCRVVYSNPNEYGHESPVTMVLPVYPGISDDPENPNVVLDPIRIISAPEGEQNPVDMFYEVLHCETLFRPADIGDGTEWMNARESLEWRTKEKGTRCAWKLNGRQCENTEHDSQWGAHLIEGEFLNLG